MRLITLIGLLTDYNIIDLCTLWSRLIQIKDTSYTWGQNEQHVDILLNNFVNRLSFKNVYDPFWPVVHRSHKGSDIWKVHVSSGGWVEIENVKKKCRPSRGAHCQKSGGHEFHILTDMSIKK